MIKLSKKHLMDEHFLSIIVVYSDQSPIVHKVQMFEKYFTSWCTAYKWVRTSSESDQNYTNSFISLVEVHYSQKKIFKVKNLCFMISPKILIFDVLHITYVSIVFFSDRHRGKKFHGGWFQGVTFRWWYIYINDRHLRRNSSFVHC